MVKNEIASTVESFEKLKHVDENGIPYWSLRELTKPLGYSRYQKLQNAVDRAKQSMIASGKNPEEHMSQSGHLFTAGNGAVQKTDDIKLSQYGAYLVAMNGDPNKQEIASAQEYFAQSAAVKNKAEKVIKGIEDDAYIRERALNKAANKQFVGTCLNNGVKEEELPYVISKGDEGMYNGKNTKQMKEGLNISDNRPLSDFLGPEVTSYKTTATYLAKGAIEESGANGAQQIADINYESNKLVRGIVTSYRKKTPEELITNNDVKKVERRRAKELKAREQELERIAEKLHL